MNAAVTATSDTGRKARYARCVKMSKQVEWQIDRDVIRGRQFDFSRSFLPDGLSFADRLDCLSPDEARLMSQVQGRTYATLFGVIERFISAKVLERSQRHALGDQDALEGLVRFSSEEIKHQALFREVGQMLEDTMPAGYVCVADANAVASAVLASGNWAVLALTCHIELFVQAHFEQSIAPRQELCPLWKDVFHFHFKDECQHAILDELEWTAEHALLTVQERDRGVDELIALVGAIDGILQAQAAADSAYFARCVNRLLGAGERAHIEACVLAAYRWQYILSGLRHVHFSRLLKSMTTPEQMARIQQALAPLSTI